MSTPVPLRTVAWRDENHRADSPGTGCYTMPPPWNPPETQWQVTRFEVLEDGAALLLWFAAIPAVPAHPHADEPLIQELRDDSSGACWLDWYCDPPAGGQGFIVMRCLWEGERGGYPVRKIFEVVVTPENEIEHRPPPWVP